ncbi:NAD(P)-dependent malic enzyme [Portibacter lacus]|uniref:Malate dehydrogenase n=1 Tax=Portibacter lacus TaxID=1099794 RepID=A0AA37SQN2_9BACT|nr:NADP-dependent malic enzyme [Portibacter lacus]GLR17709.1 malate dehydrogenase [Portibacter lacus]
MDYNLESIKLHAKHKGKIQVTPKIEVRSKEDLSMVYSPGVAGPCLEIEKNPEAVYDLTIKGNTVAIVSDGSAVLGLGNIGPLAAIPVMEGKAMLFKRFAGIDAFPICVDSQDADKIIETVKMIAPVFGGVNLEDISAPRSFIIENALQDLGIPVFHDDQHGTAIVVLAALINASKVVKKPIREMRIIVNGAGAAGIAIAKLLKSADHVDEEDVITAKEVIMCDSKGIIHKNREDLNDAKKEMIQYTNPNNEEGSLKDAMHNADVFIGVSVGEILSQVDIRNMAESPIVFALANPTPEIWPGDAYEAGAVVVGTGRSDMPNQINNVLGFPGIFRGALDARAVRITPKMKLAAAFAIADCIEYPFSKMVIPPSLNFDVASKVAAAVKKAAEEDSTAYNKK